MKSSRQALPRDVALPSKYGSFFSFPAAKGGYSGVVVYTRADSATPLKAEEGLSGRLQPKVPLTTEEQISTHYPSVHDIDAFPDEEGKIPVNFEALDSEGRGLVLDFGLFVLINVYCPNETSDARTSFKMNYHLMLEERVRILVQEGREVIVLGDMNICATPADHCDGHLPSNASTFWEHPARAWFHRWLHPQGSMIDVVRTYWPNRKGMFTCEWICFLISLSLIPNFRYVGWNTKIQARETNYGTRVDYILVTPGLLKWIKHGDIQPSLKGSDHCPIYIDLHDEITTESGETLRLRDAMQQGSAARELPRIAAKYWNEFKQSQLSAFFGKKGEVAKAKVGVSPVAISGSKAATSGKPPKDDAGIETQKKPPTTATPTTAKKRASSNSLNISSSSNKKAKKDSGAGTISSFFQKTKPVAAPSRTASSSVDPIAIEVDSDAEQSKSVITTSVDDAEQLDADYRLACELAELEEAAESSPTPPTGTPSSSQSKAAWATLFAPAQPPKCTVHGEPAKKFTVNKAGPNKGRSFYVCSRYVYFSFVAHVHCI